MAQVFISYSRKDKEFVRKLGDALSTQKREAWVDWKDIPLTAEWQWEILANIETATRQRASEAGLEVRDVKLPAGLHGAVAYAGSAAAPRLRHFPTDRAAIARLLRPRR